MNNKGKLLCISSIDWNFLWQRHQTFVKEFSRYGWRVDYVENTYFRNPKFRDVIRLKNSMKLPTTKSNEIPDNVKVIPPMVLPPNGLLFRFINRLILIPRLLKKLEREYDMVILYMPSYTTEIILRNVKKSWTIFDYVAHFEGHPDRSRDYLRIESRIMKQINMVTTDSNFLYDLLKTKHSCIHQIHHGVQIDQFLSEDNEHTIESYQKLCFFGGIDDRINWKVIKELAEAGYEVTLIGPTKVKIPEYVTHKPAMSIPDLVQELRNYDAFLIPYLLNEYNQGIIPAKIYECFAMGKPVLAAPLPSLQSLDGLIYLCDQSEDYIRVVQRLPFTERPELRNKRREVAIEQSTAHNFKKLISIIQNEREHNEKKAATRH